MTAYSDRVIRVTQQVLLEVFQLLEKFHESLTLNERKIMQLS
jgi:hypothetical protein